MEEIKQELIEIKAILSSIKNQIALLGTDTANNFVALEQRIKKRLEEVESFVERSIG